ncbi:MAG: Gfo/Idh/MocA family oxidoreductase [Proteobacteria bacterium]|nr:Gfo/Idh/MocA family oxidoreductase [Pseudomonadota bacterium]
MGDPIRYGIIGSGMMGLEHILNIALFDDAVLTAAADPFPKSRERALKVAGHELELYEDYRDLLAKAPVDAVVVCTPNFTHADVLADVFQTDVHVLVEKPLCTTVADCRRVEEAAARHPGVVWVGMEYRYMPPITRLVEEARAGTAGRLHMVSIREHRFPFLKKVGDWNRFARNTGGTLVEKCCHFFDLMNLILQDRPVRVIASGAQDVNHLDESYAGETPDILDNAYVIVDYAGGTRALLDLCMFAEGSRNEQEICVVGDAGKLECFVPESTLVVGRRHPKSVATETIEVEERALKAGFHHGSTYYEHLHFQHAIRTGAAPAVDATAGLWAVAVGQAAEQSIAEGRPVALRELGVGDLG